ncbi:DNA polymerase III subunit delta' [Vespertiliibacter pulmonis]|uniref:DNA polymerase III subunit delta' n=1 Tax=Vespertiliibacter pulmonis TaxID=1443036 RepID=A0A3N4VME1_9PAST|nr:DNA polymerase III subunit delta' [Vespertiliibacter pulmonis]QLB20681.1 DNA polymerase III subunit delta' [Vespertiliibacter pulmonis]RPE82565.1 DNA polymerase III delta prime subunit [Vespertiliibacter pulmonis]
MMNLYPWHIETYQKITESFLNGRGHHALLFKTDSGLGTEQLILQLVQWLFCQNPNYNQPCRQCKSCLLWESGNHPDFHQLESLEGRAIGVEQVREITTKLQQFSQQGGNSVVYIAQAEKLTESAANALLKTLEEPPENTYFLLQAPLQTAMLATIQSRCQTWVIHSAEFEQGIQWLHSQLPNLDINNIETALRICHNRPLISKKLLETNRLPSRRAFLQTFWRFYKSRDVWLLLTAFDKEKEPALEQLEWLDSFFSDALKAKMEITTGWVNPDLQAGIFPFSEGLSTTALLNGHHIIQQTAQDLREVNAVNQQLMLADCVTKLVDLF